jgi:hypothetical protein
VLGLYHKAEPYHSITFKYLVIHQNRTWICITASIQRMSNLLGKDGMGCIDVNLVIMWSRNQQSRLTSDPEKSK